MRLHTRPARAVAVVAYRSLPRVLLKPSSRTRRLEKQRKTAYDCRRGPAPKGLIGGCCEVVIPPVTRGVNTIWDSSDAGVRAAGGCIRQSGSRAIKLDRERRK